MLAALAVCGYWLLFTQYMVYDDEGYVLWSLLSYFAEGGLYTTVYSQYGPFLYAFYDALHRLLHLDFDNTTGRWLTLFYWTGCSALAAAFTWQQTRRFIAAIGAAVFTFGALLVMINEPIHPGGLLAFLAAVGAVGGAWLIERGRTSAFAMLTGGIGATMLLTKINVGAFFLIAAGSWLAMHSARPAWSRTGHWLTVVGSLLVPLALMQRLWPTPWVAIFALCFSCAALSLLVLNREQPESRHGLRSWLIFAGSAMVPTAIVLLAVGLRGTSLGMLWFGVAVAPLQQPTVFAHAVTWSFFTPLLALALILLAVYFHRYDPPWRPHVLAGLKLVAIALLLGTIPTVLEYAQSVFALKFGLPFAWLMTVPLQRDTHSPLLRARLWLAWVFIWQCLHAYPVAGSQMGWGAFLWITLAATGGTEAWLFLAQQCGARQKSVRWLGGVLALVGAGATLGYLGHAGWLRYRLGQPLGLHGAQNLRLVDDITATFRILDKNIRRHGDMLFSHPGMFSLNIWTERPTPTASNVTHWFSLLNEPQQQAIIDRLSDDPRAVVVAQSYLINYLVEHGYPPAGPLQRYLVRNFHAAFRINSFEFWVHNGRSIAPLSIATITKDQQLELVTTADGVAASIEVRGLFYPHNRVALFTPTPNGKWTVTALQNDGSVQGEQQPVTQAVTLSGLNRLRLPVDPTQLPPLDLLEVVILDPAGHALDALMFAQ